MPKFAKDLAEFQGYVDQTKDGKLLVVDFTASWCGPCRFIAPHFEQLAEQNPDVIFIKVDVDEADDVAQQQQVQAMPTFKFFKNGGEVKSFAGADLEKLKTCVAELK